jgi:hypothetical protein
MMIAWLGTSLHRRGRPKESSHGAKNGVARFFEPLAMMELRWPSHLHIGKFKISPELRGTTRPLPSPLNLL